MDKSGKIYKTYVQTLKEELIPAMGCTEPIAIAYAAAKAREVLGCEPDLVKIGVSNNIIKNVKSVVVPNTDGKASRLPPWQASSAEMLPKSWKSSRRSQ